MPLWGANANDESKPKNLTAEEKSRVFATTRGWEIRRPDGLDEVLVAIGNLSGAGKLGVATISQVFFLANSYSTGATGTVRVVWNEKITPTATTGTLLVRNATSSTNITATRAGGVKLGGNALDFNFTVPSVAGLTLNISSQTISTQTANDFGFTTVTASMVIAATAVTAAAVDGGATSVTTV
jgi:hypothetical protein